MSAVIVIEGKEYSIEDFNLDLFPDYMTDWKIGGITDPLGQLVSWLWDQISGAFTYVLQKVWDFLVDISKTIINALKPVVEAVSTFIGNLVKGVSDALGTLSTWITAAINAIATTIGNIATALAAIGTQILNSITSAISSIVSTLSSIAGSIISTLGSWANKIIGFIQNLPSIIGGALEAARQWIVNTIQGILTALGNAWKAIWDTIAGGVNWLIQGISSFVSQIWSGLVSLGSSIASTFVSWGNTLGGWITTAASTIVNTLGSAIAAIPAVLSGLVGSLTNILNAFTSTIGGALTTLGTSLTTGLGNVINTFETAFDGVQTAIGGVIETIFGGLSEFFRDPWGIIMKGIDSLKSIIDIVIGTILYSITGKPLKPGVSGISVIQDIVTAPTQITANQIIESGKHLVMPTEKYPAWRTWDAVETALEDWVDQANVAFTAVQLAQVAMEIGSFKLAQTGASFVPQFPSFRAAIDNAYVMLMDQYDAAVRQPLRYRWNHVWTPRIPDEETLVTGLWRVWWDDPNAKNIVRDWLMALGYNEFFHPAIEARYRTYPRLIYPGDPGFRLVQRNKVGLAGFLQYARFDGWREQDAEKMWTVIYEAPARETLFQLYWRGKLPMTWTPVPEPVEPFLVVDKPVKTQEEALMKYMGWLGYDPDMTKAMVELTKHIPGVSDLIRFAVLEAYPASETDFRTRLKMPEEHLAKLMEWGQKQGLIPYWIYANWFAHWRLPELRQVYEAFFRGILSTEELDLFLTFLDYNPDVRRGFRISERELVRRMRYSLPTRIMSRWLLRWRVLEPTEYETLYKVLGFGDFTGDMALKAYDGSTLKLKVADLVEAEYRNATSEERTLVRGSFLTLYKEGMITLDILTKALKGLYFLDLEIKMLAERAILERQIDLYKDYSGELIKAYMEGAITVEELEKELLKYIKDPEVIKSLAATLALRKMRDTTSRVRKEADKAIDSLLNVYEDGFMPEADVTGRLGQYVAQAKLTPEELTLILEQSKNRRMRTFIRWSYNALMKMFRRGEIGEAEFKAGAKKFGLPDEVINALIVGEGRYYELSPTNILYYGTYIPIPEKWLKKEMDRIGVPLDHQAIMLAYNKLAPTSDERSKVVTDVISDYATGYVTEEQLRDWLKKLGKSPDEAEFLVTHAQADQFAAVNKLREQTITQLYRSGVISIEIFIEGLVGIGKSKEMAIELAQLEYAKKEDSFLPRSVYDYAALLS